jgi:iodotyrosine deiodinase
MERIPLTFDRLDPAEMETRARAFARSMARRRSVREFSPDPIPAGVLEAALQAAGAAPSGANRQPWHFAVVRSAEVKRRIRLAAEEEERAFYEGRATDAWLEALAPLGTDAAKPFLETAPALIAIFQQNQQTEANGELQQTYYPKESVGLATGILLAALHEAGLATLTHTPSPMGFLNQILARPAFEKPFLLLVVGFPTPDCTVPAIARKPLEAFTSWH